MSRTRLGALVGLVALVLCLGLSLGQPGRAEAVPSPCDLPGVSLVCDAGGALLGVAGDAAGAVAGQVASGVLSELTGWVGDGAAWLVRRVAAAALRGSEVDLTAAWFAPHYRFMAAVGGLLLLPFLLLAALQALLRQDPALLVRAALVQLPAAMLLTGLAVAVTEALVQTTDALSGAVAEGMAADAGRLAEAFSAVVLAGGGASPLPVFVGFLIALLMAAGAFAVWVELILRSAAILGCLAFLPLLLSAMVWPASARWARRLGEILGALILSKLVIVSTLALGLSALTSAASPGTVLAGAALFVIAAFSPFVLLALIPLAGEVGHVGREGRRAVAAATGAAAVWQAARWRLVGGLSPGGSAGAGGVASRPPPAAPAHAGAAGGAMAFARAGSTEGFGSATPGPEEAAASAAKAGPPASAPRRRGSMGPPGPPPP